MQMFALLSIILVITVPAVSANDAQTNPMAKVFEMIDDLSAKIQREGEAEAAAYKEFFAWCDETSRDTGNQIKTATSTKDKLEATIDKATSDAEASAAKIDDLAAKIAEDEADLKSATQVREKEAADFAASEAELVETCDTLARAIGIIEKEMAKTGSAALAQVDTSSISKLLKTMSTLMDAAAFPNADKKKLVALVQSQQADADDDAEFGAPAAATYKSQSGGILDLLEDLKEKSDTELADLRKTENQAKHAFNMLKQGLEDAIKADTDDLNEEKDSKAASEELKATSEKDLEETVKELADANQALNLAHTNCMQTAADHEASTNARAEELAVIAKAKKILEDSTSGAVSQSYSLLQIQSRSDLQKREVATMVKKLAQQYHSAALAQLASKVAAVVKFGVSAGDDPFAKIKGLISDMIAKLEQEALDAANEKAYCDEQMSKTKAKKDELEGDMGKLNSKIDTATSKSTGLKEDVRELQAELAALSKQQAEMDKIRQDQHSAYVQASTDLKAGLAGVRKALGVLRDYYGSAAAGASLLEAPMPAMPTTHSKSGGAGGGIIGILEVCESDFAKGLATVETEESDAQSEYDETTQKNKVTKAMKEQDVKFKTQNFNGLDKEIAELSSDAAATQTELDAVLEYYGQVKDRCIAKPETYEERKARREAEIAGLKEALATLENETALVQRGKRSLRKHFLGAQ